MHHVPIILPEVWASQLVEQSGDLIGELRLLGDGGRVYRRGEAPFGEHDFRIAPGAPFLVQADAPGSVFLSGEQRTPQPIALRAGWNPVGIVDATLGMASDLIGDAAAQGVTLGAVVDGGGQTGFVAGSEARGAGGDFSLEEAQGVWVFACGQGGLWTPGAGGAGGIGGTAAAGGVGGADGPPRERRRIAREANGRGQAACPDLEVALAELPADLMKRIASELVVCVPEQTVLVAGEPVPVCDSPPGTVTDLRADNLVCANQPAYSGCALTLRTREIREDIAGQLSVIFDAEAIGTATLADGTGCPIDVAVSDALFLADYGTQLSPPAIDLFTTATSAPGLAALQTGCGADADLAIAALVADAIEETLAQEIETRLTGLAPHCSPDFPLPDVDLDGVVDCSDGCPLDADKTDPGLCGCGVVDDVDGDGFAFCGFDCDDADDLIWSTPGEVRSLMLTHDGAIGETTLVWSPPLAPGGSALRYDTLGAAAPDGFDLADCIESDDGADTEAVTGVAPDPGDVSYVLVRAENDCASGQGTLGIGPAGADRTGRDCP
jgi:hypothetical protein